MVTLLHYFGKMLQQNYSKPYTSVKLPSDLVKQIDDYKVKHKKDGFTSRQEIIRIALRQFFNNNGGAWDK